MTDQHPTSQFNSDIQNPIEESWHDPAQNHVDPEEPIDRTISPPHDSATMEWLEMPPDAISFQQPTQDELFEVPLKESQSFNPEEENDVVLEDSPTYGNKREDKHLRRRIKNEKNYRDLNRSLANLGRTTRDNSYDNNTWTCHSQSHTQTETNYKSPFIIPKIIYSTPKSAQTEFNTPTSLMPKKVQSNQNSSRHNDDKLFEFSVRQKPYDSLKAPPKEAVYIKSTYTTPKGGLLAPSNYYSLDMKVKPKDNKILKEEKAFEYPWENNNRTTAIYPGSNDNIKFANRTMDNKDLARWNNNENPDVNLRPKIFGKEKRPYPATVNYSFRDTIGMKGHILDSPLPSKAELNERPLGREVEGSGPAMREKIMSSGGIPIRKNFEDTFSVQNKPLPKKIVDSPPKPRVQEETAFSFLAKEEFEACKNDLLSIKKDIEDRQKSHKEVDKFFQNYGSVKLKKTADDCSPRSAGSRMKKDDVRSNSIFSATNMSRNTGYEPKSANFLPMDCLTPKSEGKARKQNVNRSGLVSFDLKFNNDFNGTQILNQSLQEDRKSPEFRIRESFGSYFGAPPSNTKTDTDKLPVYPNADKPTQPSTNYLDQSTSCNMF